MVTSNFFSPSTNFDPDFKKIVKQLFQTSQTISLQVSRRPQHGSAIKMNDKCLKVCMALKNALKLNQINVHSDLIEEEEEVEEEKVLTNKIKYLLQFCKNSFEYSNQEILTILDILKEDSSISAIRDFNMSWEKQQELRSFEEILLKNMFISTGTDGDEIEIKLNALKQSCGWCEWILDGMNEYLSMLTTELQMLSDVQVYEMNTFEFEGRSYTVPNLENKTISFVGSGFPFSCIMQNILTKAKINMIDNDKDMVEKSELFIELLAKHNIVRATDFKCLHADGKDLSYKAANLENNDLHTDILQLAAFIPTSVKLDILKSLKVNNQINIVVFYRYASDLFMLLYPENCEQVPYFKTISKTYPPAVFKRKQETNSNIRVIIRQYETIASCSSRLLVLDSSC